MARADGMSTAAPFRHDSLSTVEHLTRGQVQASARRAFDCSVRVRGRISAQAVRRALGHRVAVQVGRSGPLHLGNECEMSRTTRKDRTNTIQLLILLVGFVLLFYCAITSLTAREPLWFLSDFKGQPSHIVVYHAGQRTELGAGQAGFNELTGAVETSLAGGFVQLTSLGLSEHSLEEAYTRYVTLEIFFDQPVELRTWFNPGRTTHMLFLITGPYSDMSVVLLGDEGQYRAGAPALKTIEPIREALKALMFY